MTRLFALVGILVSVCGVQAATAAPVAWRVPVLDRIAPDTPPGDATDVTLEAGRREIVSFQIAVQAGGARLTDLRFRVGHLADGSGHTIGGESVVLYRENFVTLKRHSPVFNRNEPNQPQRRNVIPDALLPFIDPLTGKPPRHAKYSPEPIELPANSDTAYWVDVNVPVDAVPGVYTGRYVASARQGMVSGSIRLTVLPFTVPLMPTLHTSMNSDTTDPRGETGELLRNRLMPDQVPLEKERHLIAKYGLAGTDLGFYSGAYYGHCRMKKPPAVDVLRRAAESHDQRLFLFDFSADEIEKCRALFPMVREWARRLHDAGVPNLVTMAPVPYLLSDGSGTGRSAVDIWTVLPVEYVQAQAKNPPRITEVLKKGDAVWFYTALVQDGYSPKWEADFRAVDFRLPAGFINASLGLTGILYWSVDYWTKHPWEDIEYPGGCSGGYCWSYPGEGFMVYPGKEAGLEGVAPSLRLKYIRDGVQDYERIAILDRCGHGAEAKDIARSVGRSYKDWTRKDEAVFEASRKLGALIVGYGCSR